MGDKKSIFWINKYYFCLFKDGPNKRHFPVAQNYYQQRPTMIMPRTQNRPRSLISITPHEDNNQTQGSESTNQIEPGKGIKRHCKC